MELSTATKNRVALIKVIDDNPDKFTQRFKDWIYYNTDIWEEFEKRTLALIKKDRVHFSAKAIFEYMRWDVPTKDNQNIRRGTSLPNATSPYMVRLWGILHPRYDEFFIQKPLRGRLLDGSK